MVRLEDYIRDRPGIVRDRWLNVYAKARQDNAQDEGRDPEGVVFSCYEEAVYGNKVGLTGEWAPMVYLSSSRLSWMFFKTGRISGQPDLTLYPWLTPPLMDAKCNKQRYPTNYLIVPLKDPRGWIFILCYIDEAIPENWVLVRPKVVIVGWCFGFEAKQERHWMQNPKLGRTFQVPHHDEILRPMKQLRVLLALCETYGMELGLQKWKERGGVYEPERYPEWDPPRQVQAVPPGNDQRATALR